VALRGTVAFLCLLFTVLLTIPSLSAVWMRGELLDSGGFTGNASKLIDEPVIRQEIAKSITAQVNDRIDSRVQGSVPKGAVETAVLAMMGTDEFHTVWDQGVRAAHSTVTAALLGKDTDTVQTDGSQVQVNLKTPLEPLVAELAKRGIKVDTGVLPVNIPIDLAEIPQSGTVQDAAKTLDDAGWMLPVLALLLLAVGLAVAVKRARALAVTSVGVVAMAGLVLLVVSGVQSEFVGKLASETTLSEGAVDTVYNVFTDSLTTYSWTVVAVFGVLALAGTALAAMRPHR
jgi:hypothetical protein